MSVNDETFPLPVTAVTCLEDRAQVERTAAVELAAGVHRLRLGPVSALAVDRSLHAALLDEDGAPAAAGKVLDVRLVRSWRPPAPVPPGPDDSALRRRVHELERDHLAEQRRQERLQARLALLGQLAADLLREIGEGAALGELEQARWTRELDRVDAERESYGEQLRASRLRSVELAADLAAAEEALARAEEEPAELLAFVELSVECAAPGRFLARVGHLTACALWRPAYRAELVGGALRLETGAVVWQRTGEDWSGVRLTLSTARSALAGEPPALAEDRLVLRERSAQEKKTVEVELREQAIAEAGPLEPGLPGVDDGGEVRVLRADGPVSVPSDGRAHRVPVSVFETPARSEFAAAPELSDAVTEVVSFRNASGHALLAGPVDLVRGSGHVGRGALEFAAAGAPVRLAFGSADGLRVVRDAEERREGAGLGGQRTLVTRTVRLHLSRFSAPGDVAERVVTVRERIPVSEVSAVEVRLRKERCSPPPEELDAEGIARWEVPLPPGGRRTLTLVYEIAATAKVAGL
ncbi:mucoidy inhibitor MuiA family protein [Streptomyces sp. TLI_171]|uniref:mucoidy inhibitor MuiA family protein n=1 Tax=Streptomyces sp. TLI_171 TaxID=1938859 RepID=UPI000C1822BC|nr:mucoidy inhibitor MuiA family protein [Streptomyces sp. TLI_171]